MGGWYDTEDPQGLLRQFDFMEQNNPPADTLVMGPWNHGGFARGDGDKLGNIDFGSKTGAYYRENIELPFFLYHLKGRGDGQVGVGVSDGSESMAEVRSVAAQAGASHRPVPRRPPASWVANAPHRAPASKNTSPDPAVPVPYVGRTQSRAYQHVHDGGPRGFAAMAAGRARVLKARAARPRHHRDGADPGGI